MNAICYLSRYKDAEQELKSIVRERNHWQEMASNVSKGSLEPHYESNRNIQAPYVRCVEAVDELNLKIADKMDKLFTLRCEISDAIDSVSSIDSREVLACRYLCCMTWEDICSELKISEKTARRRHNKGIETIRID